MKVLIKEKVDFALCNSEHEPMITFNRKDLMDRWLETQKEKHGVESSLTPCRIITRIETETIA